MAQGNLCFFTHRIYFGATKEYNQPSAPGAQGWVRLRRDSKVQLLETSGALRELSDAELSISVESVQGPHGRRYMCTRTVTVSVPSSHAHLADFKEIYVFHHVLKKCVYLTHLATPGSQATATRVQKCLKIQFLSGFGRASFLHLLGKAQKTGEKTSSPLPGGSANKPLRCLAVKRCQHKGERQVPRPRRRSLRGQHSFSRHNGQTAAQGEEIH